MSVCETRAKVNFPMLIYLLLLLSLFIIIFKGLSGKQPSKHTD